MTKPAAFSASYADWKLIRTRKCVQIVFEVPLEAADAAYQVVGGMPDPGGSAWFAIAKLKQPPDEKPEREHKSWHEMTPAQQAGILCADPMFIKFLHANGVTNESEAADFVRLHCEVRSRKDIRPNTEAAKLWALLVSDYRAWVREPEFVP